MNIFLEIYKNWTIYEWILIGGSLILVFLLSNTVTYLITKNWSFNKILSITYLISAVLYILSIFVASFLIENIGNIALMPIILTLLLTTINWFLLVGYYKLNMNRKDFSLVELLNEFKRDSIRNIIVLTIAILSVLIFLRNELLLIFVTTYISTSLSIFLSSILARRFIHD